MKLITLKLNELVFDPEIYPRGSVNRDHVEVMRQAYHAGAKFPPFVIDETSRKIIDGAHRREIYVFEDKTDVEVECIANHYANEGEMFLDAMRLNAAHGLPLSPFDRARAAAKCRKFGLGAMAIAAALGMTPDKLRAIGEGRTATVAVDRSPTRDDRQHAPQADEEIVLKRSVKHLRGRKISPTQAEAMKALSERNQADTVEELIVLLESGLLDVESPTLMTRLRYMRELLDELFASIEAFASGPLAEKSPESLAGLQGVE
jgi:hypothetical protein